VLALVEGERKVSISKGWHALQSNGVTKGIEASSTAHKVTNEVNER
jgi:hypothetical protein